MTLRLYVRFDGKDACKYRFNLDGDFLIKRIKYLEHSNDWKSGPVFWHRTFELIHLGTFLSFTLS